jgi:hypothetical protein
MCPRPTAQAIRDLKGDSFSLDEDAEAAAVPGEVVNSPPDDFAAQLGGVMGASFEEDPGMEADAQRRASALALALADGVRPPPPAPTWGAALAAAPPAFRDTLALLAALSGPSGAFTRP